MTTTGAAAPLSLPPRLLLRVGKLGNVYHWYGPRGLTELVPGKPTSLDLSKWSLIIPCVFAVPHDAPLLADPIPPATEHLRYLGLLDLDTDLEALKAAQAPLFTDRAAQSVYPDTKQYKRAFVQRMLADNVTFGQIAEVCTPFGALLALVEEVAAALPREAEAVIYYSGGCGFRILFWHEKAWRRVRYSDRTYAPAWVEASAKGPLFSLLLDELKLPGLLVERLAPYVDKNIYDVDKGVKPDVLAHFETGIFPLPLTDLRTSRPSRGKGSALLISRITTFWRRLLFERVPTPASSWAEHVPLLTGVEEEEAMGGPDVSPIQSHRRSQRHHTPSAPVAKKQQQQQQQRQTAPVIPPKHLLVGKPLNPIPGIYASPAARAHYWRDLFPWRATWYGLLAAAREEEDEVARLPAVAHNWYREEEGDSVAGASSSSATIRTNHVTRKMVHSTLEAWQRAAMHYNTTSLHAVIPPQHYLVFDIDTRTQKEARFQCAGRHDEHDVCATCFGQCAAAALCVLDVLIVETLGLDQERAPLYVFSGRGGLHVYYRLDKRAAGRAEPIIESLTNRMTRRLLVEHWLSTAHQRRHPRIKDEPTMRNSWVTFDAGHSWDVFVQADGRHHPALLKLPFSLHNESGRPALPLARGPLTGLLELPWHLQQPHAAHSTHGAFDAVFARALDLYLDWLK